MKTKLVHIVIDSVPYIAEEWKIKHHSFLEEEHLKTFAERLYTFLDEGVPNCFPEPHFKEEITPSLKISFNYFAEILEEIKDAKFQVPNSLKESLVQVIMSTPFEHLLLLLGQRLTPASIQDERAIPPLRVQLVKSCFQPYNTEVSQVVRAWEKHVGRHSDSFWGAIKGNNAQKEIKVQKLVNYILGHTTWWNVFYHYKHGYVYEARVASGQGIRWKLEDIEFIGFLEHFE